MFRKIVVPQNTPKWSFLVGKPMVVGYPYFWKHPYIYIDHIYMYIYLIHGDLFFKCWLIWLIHGIYGICTSISLIFMVNVGKYTSDWWGIIRFPIYKSQTKNRGILWMQDSGSWDMPVETQTTKMLSASSSGGDKEGFSTWQRCQVTCESMNICTNKHKKQKKQG